VTAVAVRATSARDLRMVCMWWKAQASSHTIVTNPCRRGVSSVIGHHPLKPPFRA
jgi:hypothetical protein